jgi:hypothetical protein
MISDILIFFFYKHLSFNLFSLSLSFYFIYKIVTPTPPRYCSQYENIYERIKMFICVFIC